MLSVLLGLTIFLDGLSAMKLTANLSNEESSKFCKRGQAEEFEYVPSLETAFPHELWNDMLAFNQYKDLYSLTLTSKSLRQTMLPQILNAVINRILNGTDGMESVGAAIIPYIVKNRRDPVLLARLVIKSHSPNIIGSVAVIIKGMTELERESFGRQFFSRHPQLAHLPCMEAWGAGLTSALKNLDYLENVVKPLAHAGPDFILAQIISKYQQSAFFRQNVAVDLVRYLRFYPVKPRLFSVLFQLWFGTRMLSLIPEDGDGGEAVGMGELLLDLQNGSAFFENSQDDLINILKGEDFSPELALAELFTGHYLHSIKDLIINNVATGIWPAQILPSILENMEGMNICKSAELTEAKEVAKIFFGKNYDFEPTELTDFQLRLANCIAGNCKAVPAELSKNFWAALESMRPDVLEFCLQNLYWNADFQGSLMDEIWSSILKIEDDHSKLLLSYFPSRNAKRWLAFSLLLFDNPKVMEPLRKDWDETNWERSELESTQLMLSVDGIPGWQELWGRFKKEA